MKHLCEKTNKKPHHSKEFFNGIKAKNRNWRQRTNQPTNNKRGETKKHLTIITFYAKLNVHWCNHSSTHIFVQKRIEHILFLCLCACSSLLWFLVYTVHVFGLTETDFFFHRQRKTCFNLHSQYQEKKKHFRSNEKKIHLLVSRKKTKTHQILNFKIHFILSVLIEINSLLILTLVLKVQFCGATFLLLLFIASSGKSVTTDFVWISTLILYHWVIITLVGFIIAAAATDFLALLHHKFPCEKTDNQKQ